MEEYGHYLAFAGTFVVLVSVSLIMGDAASDVAAWEWLVLSALLTPVLAFPFLMPMALVAWAIAFVLIVVDSIRGAR